jgi:hypothetical protein
MHTHQELKPVLEELVLHYVLRYVFKRPLDLRCHWRTRDELP